MRGRENARLALFERVLADFSHRLGELREDDVVIQLVDGLLDVVEDLSLLVRCKLVQGPKLVGGRIVAHRLVLAVLHGVEVLADEFGIKLDVFEAKHHLDGCSISLAVGIEIIQVLGGVAAVRQLQAEVFIARRRIAQRV